MTVNNIYLALIIAEIEEYFKLLAVNNSCSLRVIKTVLKIVLLVQYASCSVYIKLLSNSLNLTALL